ncbi:MAG: hypothetical protein EBR82_72035 [Caulobacteraceae bacterium]|nr:hypothetical protein [Caulobacteraceae bacterium]
MSNSDMTTRKEQMGQKCTEFHNKHPEVWALFVKFTKQVIARGHCNYGAGAVFERIRWELDTVGADGKSTFKLNNNFCAFYARRFHAVYPEHHGFFRTRAQTSSHRAASKLPELGPNDYPETRE